MGVANRLNRPSAFRARAAQSSLVQGPLLMHEHRPRPCPLIGSGANIEVCTLRRLERQWSMQQGLHSRSQAQLGL